MDEVFRVVINSIVVYFSAIFMMKIGDKRVLGKNTTFDILLGIILGSVLSGAINGSSKLLPTLAAAFTLVIVHWVMAWASYRWPGMSNFFKGRVWTLVKDGQLQEAMMRKTHVSQFDMEAAMRLDGRQLDLSEVKLACLERDGSISVVLKPE